MEVRDLWLVKIGEQQKVRQTVSRKGDFLHQVRVRQSERQVQSIRLRRAACAASLAWFFAAIQTLLPS